MFTITAALAFLIYVVAGLLLLGGLGMAAFALMAFAGYAIEEFENSRKS